ncbi:MAG: NGG1p interacting factor NIF3, partial [Parcubacteria group bacterium]
IDIDAGELLIAKELGADAVIAHHPIGKGLSYLDDVMQLQADVLAQYGVPINVAEGLMRIRISEVSRSVNPVNHFKSPMAAKNLGMSFMNVHTPADNMVATFLKKLMDDKKPEYVSEVIEILEKIPEYKEAKKQGLGPRLFAGNKENRAGKIAITEITGGTEGSVKIYEKMANAGVGTILAMHQSEKHREAAEKANINVVIAGHISSDSIGVNLFLDELEKKGIKIIPCSGLIRYSRVKK